MKKITYLPIIALATVTALSSCKKDEKEPTPTPTPTPVTPVYTIPTTYNFANADFSTSTQRIEMLGELTTYIRSTHTTTQATQPTLSAAKMKNMYENLNNPFASASLNSSSVQLKNKTIEEFKNLLDANFDDAVPASVAAALNPTATTASNGVKGKLKTSSRAILVDDKGFEYKEFVEKGIMGAVFYYQATTILKGIGSFDNTNQVNGATAQERAWDEAFGYFGVPVAFPTNTVGLKNWGNYCNSVNVAINSNATIMNAFLKGRAAISAKDNAGRDEARNVVIATWEKVAAAKCISYLKGAKTNIQDIATLHHNLSEGWGFVNGFKFNPSKSISDADIALLLSYFGSNFYTLDPANLDLAITKLETVFGLNAAIIP